MTVSEHRHSERCMREGRPVEQKDVIEFFNRCAQCWDDEMIRNEEIIRTILDNAHIRAGVDVLENGTTSLIRVVAA